MQSLSFSIKLDITARASTHKYLKNGFKTWLDLKKISLTKLRIIEPTIEFPNYKVYKHTKHSANIVLYFFIPSMGAWTWDTHSDILDSIYMDCQLKYNKN